MINHDGKMIDEALPSTPIEILGMNGTAYAGTEFIDKERRRGQRDGKI